MREVEDAGRVVSDDEPGCDQRVDAAGDDSDDGVREEDLHRPSAVQWLESTVTPERARRVLEAVERAAGVFPQDVAVDAFSLAARVDHPDPAVVVVPRDLGECGKKCLAGDGAAG